MSVWFIVFATLSSTALGDDGYSYQSSSDLSTIGQEMPRKKWDEEKIVGEIRRLHDKGQDLSDASMKKEHSALCSVG